MGVLYIFCLFFDALEEEFFLAFLARLRKSTEKQNMFFFKRKVLFKNLQFEMCASNLSYTAASVNHKIRSIKKMKIIVNSHVTFCFIILLRGFAVFHRLIG